MPLSHVDRVLCSFWGMRLMRSLHCGPPWQRNQKQCWIFCTNWAPKSDQRQTRYTEALQFLRWLVLTYAEFRGQKLRELFREYAKMMAPLLQEFRMLGEFRMQFEHGTNATVHAWDEAYYSGLLKSHTHHLTSSVGISYKKLTTFVWNDLIYGALFLSSEHVWKLIKTNHRRSRTNAVPFVVFVLLIFKKIPKNLFLTFHFLKEFE